MSDSQTIQIPIEALEELYKNRKILNLFKSVIDFFYFEKISISYIKKPTSADYLALNKVFSGEQQKTICDLIKLVNMYEDFQSSFTVFGYALFDFNETNEKLDDLKIKELIQNKDIMEQMIEKIIFVKPKKVSGVTFTISFSELKIYAAFFSTLKKNKDSIISHLGEPFFKEIKRKEKRLKDKKSDMSNPLLFGFHGGKKGLIKNTY